MARGEVRRSFAPDVHGIAEVLHASLTAHRYPKHCHDSWTVLLIDDGAVDFELGGRRRRATTSNVTLLPPFVAHDGHSAQEGRPFRKRVLYLHDERLAEHLIGAAVDRPHLADRHLRRCVSAFHDALDRGPDDLELETLLTSVVVAIINSRSIHAASSSPMLRSFWSASPTDQLGVVSSRTTGERPRRRETTSISPADSIESSAGVRVRVRTPTWRRSLRVNFTSDRLAPSLFCN